MGSSRIYFLDSLKGILIILVIVGHAIQYGHGQNYDYNNDLIFRFIYSFHMPLFFFISGLLANRGHYNPGLIAKRAKQLLVPFVVWAFIGYLRGVDSLDECFHKILYPDCGLWFLYNLFVYSAIFNVAEMFEERFRIRHSITVALSICLLGVLMFAFGTKFNCTQLCYNIPFYAFGYYYKKIISCKYCNVLNNSKLNGGGYLLLIPFHLVGWGDTLPYGLSYLFVYAVKFTGTLFFYNLGKTYLDKKLPLLQWIGGATLGIYAFQFPFLGCWNWIGIQPGYLRDMIISILTLIACCTAVFMVRKVKYVRLLLIGEK